ncbi:MAG: muconolactone Delta-isomerase [Paracoccaceae bacterium]
MLFMVRMDVELPFEMPANVAADVIAREKAYAQDLQRQGIWKGLWRIVGEYANFSLFEVQDNNQLQDILQNLPLYPYMKCQVTPLATHPSAV